MDSPDNSGKNTLQNLNYLFAVSQEGTDDKPTSNLAQAVPGAPQGNGFHHPEQDYDENTTSRGKLGHRPTPVKHLTSHGNEQPLTAARCTLNGLGSPNSFFMEKNDDCFNPHPGK